MTLSDIGNLLNSPIENNTVFKQIKNDSRLINRGDIFLIINSGHLYIDDAINRGAVCIISDRLIKKEIPTIIVRDTIESLKIIASYLRSKFQKPIIAITGSVGKTSTKELIGKTLSTTRNVLMSEGNQNNIIGVCNTLLKLNDKYDVAVLEVGMNHEGEISEISSILKPTIAIITNIGTSHIANLKTIKNILKAKLEIMAGNPNALLILNGEDRYLKKVSGIHCYKDTFSFTPPVKHLNMNYFLAIKICLIMGMNYDSIIENILNVSPTKQRMNIIRKNFTIIDDSYNASYESIIGGIEYLKQFENKKIIILGDILESNFTLHKKLLKPLKKISNCIYFFVGEYFTRFNFGYHFSSTEKLLSFLRRYHIEEDTMIYVKASRGWQFNLVVDFLSSL